MARLQTGSFSQLLLQRRSVPARETRATRHEAIDPRVIFNDPEAQLRRSRQMRRVMQQAANSPASSLAADDDDKQQKEMQKTAATASAAVDGGACSEAADPPLQVFCSRYACYIHNVRVVKCTEPRLLSIFPERCLMPVRSHVMWTEHKASRHRLIFQGCCA